MPLGGSNTKMESGRTKRIDTEVRQVATVKVVRSP
jgi:hypothetical protein